MIVQPQVAAEPDQGGRGGHGRIVTEGKRDKMKLVTQPAETSVNLTHHFLIAMPAMVDPNFSRTLTYICEHNDQGALGIVVNRPIDMDLATLFERVDIPLEPSGQRFAPCRCISAARCRPIAASCCTGPSAAGSRRSRSRTSIAPDQFARHSAVGERMPANPEKSWSRSATPAGPPASSNGNCRRTPGSPCRRRRSILFDLPPEERLPAAMQLLGFDFANLRRGGHA